MHSGGIGDLLAVVDHTVPEGEQGAVAGVSDWASMGAGKNREHVRSREHNALAGKSTVPANCTKLF
jgi:hypothetical protein